MILLALANFWHSHFRANRKMLALFSASSFFNLAALAFLIAKISPQRYLSLSGTIPLHYNLYFGVDVFGPWWHAFSLPLFGVMVMIVNIVSAYYVYEQEKVLSYLLMVISCIVSIIVCAASLFVVLLSM
ncbi:hypothetical protein IT409_00180 [Candidatus Falkowbacteria bacterium]|nr:hypothetical protein [Candidatus Falkowbacteria bacterium]